MFVPGVAEQFAIAEAKLRAWASLDDDDEEEDSNDEDSPTSGQALTVSSQSSGIQHFPPFYSSSAISRRSSFSCIITDNLIFPSPPSTNASIYRTSDSLLLLQTPPRPPLSAGRPASLRTRAAGRRPATVPWSPAAAVHSATGLQLISTHPRPTRRVYQATA